MNGRGITCSFGTVRCCHVAPGSKSSSPAGGGSPAIASVRAARTLTATRSRTRTPFATWRPAPLPPSTHRTAAEDEDLTNPDWKESRPDSATDSRRESMLLRSLLEVAGGGRSIRLNLVSKMPLGRKEQPSPPLLLRPSQPLGGDDHSRLLTRFETIFSHGDIIAERPRNSPRRWALPALGRCDPRAAGRARMSRRPGLRTLSRVSSHRSHRRRAAGAVALLRSPAGRRSRDVLRREKAPIWCLA